MSITTSIEASVATITLNRPEKLNAFSGAMREELLEALLACDQDAGVRAVVITGAGRAFCAGGDVDYMAGLQKQRDVTAFRRLLDAGRDVILQTVIMETPVIAAINGVAAGAGCNLAFACDYRIASDHAKLSQSFVRIGLHPDWGGTWLLPRLVGRSRAFEIMASGRMVTAEEALRLGMIDRVVPGNDLERESTVLATTVAAAPPLAVSGIKRALAAPELEGLRNQLDLEAEHQLRCFSSNDAAEGMAAFFEKRAAKFSGS
jgi:enoyl-CoA hydratase/carnithine racemase